MELAIYWLSIIGGLVIGLATTMWFAGVSKAAALWVGYFGMALFLAAFTLQLQKIYADSPSVTADSRLNQRAWVGVDRVVTDPNPPEVGKQLEVTVSFKNTGKTPALNVRGTCVTDPVKTGDKPNLSYVEVESFKLGHLPASSKAYATVRPVISKSTGEPKVVTQEIFDAILSKAIRLYVHGRIDYEDIFGEPHWLEYCSFLDVPFSGRFAACPDHNTSDDYRREK